MPLPLPSPSEMSRWDALSITEYSIREEMLMENASREAMAVLRQELAERGLGVAGLRFLVLAGPGNNGGDGFALARHILDAGGDPIVLHTRPKKSYGGASRYHMRLARRVGVTMKHLSRGAASLPSLLPGTPDVIVDAMLGTGFNGPVRGTIAELIDWCESMVDDCFLFSIDIPSGLNGLTGRPEPDAVPAHATVTFQAAKTGLAMPGAVAYTGTVHVRDIGIPLAVRNAHPARCMLMDRDLALLLPEWPLDMHKGTAGRVLVVGGSKGLTGAAHLAALAAYRSGAGLSTIACPGGLARNAALNRPEIMTLAVGEGDTWDPEAARELADRLSGFDALVIGPGMGRTPEAAQVVDTLLSAIRPPSIIDADALWAFGHNPALLDRLAASDILTPHPGECRFLLQALGLAERFPDVQEDRLAVLDVLGRNLEAVLVFKGAGTLVTDGERTLLSPFSSPNLAVGGSGDVLAGTLAGLATRLPDALDRAAFGVYIHGLAGRLLEEEHPERGNLATDIADLIPIALEELYAAG